MEAECNPGRGVDSGTETRSPALQAPPIQHRTEAWPVRATEDQEASSSSYLFTWVTFQSWEAQPTFLPLR